MDYSKLTSRDIENQCLSGKHKAKQVKKAGFQHRMDRVNKAIGGAKTQAEHNRFTKIKRETLNTYNKYNNTRHKT